MTRVSFTVPGVPAPQGSRAPYGGESNPRTKPWRAAVAAAAAEAMGDRELLTGPVKLVAVFTYPRPASHYGTGRNEGKLKPSAPTWKKSAPDLDKLVRAVGDALKYVAIRDDAQVCHIEATKVYAGKGGVFVTLAEES